MATITDAQADAYLEAPHKCPFCASTSIEGGHVEIDNGRAVQEVSCCDCEREWRDIYKLHGIETDTEPTPTENLTDAAPDLLLACETALANLENSYSSDHIVIKRLRAAIAKAKGQP